MSVAFGHSVAVLTTTGRRTGRTRKTPVTYLAYKDGYLIGGGAGGQKATPDWVHNLRATPRASLTIRRQTREYSVEDLAGEARADAFDAMAAKTPEVRTYEKRSARPLPLFLFHPI